MYFWLIDNSFQILKKCIIPVSLSLCFLYLGKSCNCWLFLFCMSVQYLSGFCWKTIAHILRVIRVIRPCHMEVTSVLVHSQEGKNGRLCWCWLFSFLAFLIPNIPHSILPLLTLIDGFLCKASEMQTQREFLAGSLHNPEETGLLLFPKYCAIYIFFFHLKFGNRMKTLMHSMSSWLSVKICDRPNCWCMSSLWPQGTWSCEMKIILHITSVEFVLLDFLIYFILISSEAYRVE